MRSMPFVSVILAILVAPGSVASQRTERAALPAEGAPPRVKFIPGQVVVTLTSAAGVSSAVPVPFSVLGDFVTIGDKVLVAGGDGSVGYMSLLVKDANGVFSEHSSVSVPQADFVGLAYDRSGPTVFRLNSASGAIERAPVSAQAIGSWQWVSHYNVSQWPGAASLGDWSLAFLHEERKVVVQHYFQPEIYDALHIAADSPISAEASPGAAATQLTLSSFDVVEGDSSLRILGPAGALIEVVRVSDLLVVGVGTIGVDRSAIVTTGALQFGQQYALRIAGSGVLSGRFSPARRQGTADVLPGGTTLHGFFESQSSRAVAGNDLFGFQMECRDLARSQGAARYPAWLLIGDPQNVACQGSRCVLMTPSYFEREVAFSPDLEFGNCATVPVPILDANLVGLQVAFQWWILVAPSDIRVSEVYSLQVMGGSVPLSSTTGSGLS